MFLLIVVKDVLAHLKIMNDLIEDPAYSCPKCGKDCSDNEQYVVRTSPVRHAPPEDLEEWDETIQCPCCGEEWDVETSL